MGLRPRHKTWPDGPQKAAKSSSATIVAAQAEIFVKESRWIRPAKAGGLFLVVAGVGLGDVFGRGEALQALEQLFFGHAVGGDLGVV